MFPEGNVPGYVCNPGSPRERDAASQGHTSGIPTRALLHSWKLAPAAHHGLLSILVVTSPAPDVWLSILTDYTYDSELDIADGVPLAFRRSVSFPRGTRVTYVTWDVLLAIQAQQPHSSCMDISLHCRCPTTDLSGALPGRYVLYNICVVL